ncbi:MAG: NAD-dependent deacylase [Bacteroidetes bacterium]|nr:NAD-dependent deacylase [Bacteroidota bacterium]
MSNPSLDDQIETVVEKLLSAKSVVVFTGAGVSAESGVPTFRDKGGMWTKFKPEELANFDAFMKNPDLVTGWYSHRRKIMSEVKPNPGHYAVAELEKLFDDFCVITQNVDNLHRRAGSKKIFELHGNIERNYCITCKKNHDLTGNYSPQAIKCECGGLVRPDVVWFGEILPQDQYAGAVAAAESCDVFFSVGTSAVVYPAAYMIIYAKQAGAFVVEVNVDYTDLSHYANQTLLGNSGEILPRIVRKIKR